MNTLQPMQAQYRAQERDPLVSCTKCKSEWFEQVAINQYRADHIVIPGQGIPVGGPQQFYILRCIKCSEMYQPIVMITAQDTVAKLYNQMLDQLEPPKDGR